MYVCASFNHLHGAGLDVHPIQQRFPGLAPGEELQGALEKSQQNLRQAVGVARAGWTETWREKRLTKPRKTQDVPLKALVVVKSKFQLLGWHSFKGYVRLKEGRW